MVAELREGWKGRLLRLTCERTGLVGRVRARSSLGAVAMSVLGHSYDRQLLALMAACFPPFFSIDPPFLCSAGRIDKAGRIIADIVFYPDYMPTRQVVIFKNVFEMETCWRRLADRIRCSDPDRLEMFAALKAWVVADMRLDPTMNPADPDARRLVS